MGHSTRRNTASSTRAGLDRRTLIKRAAISGAVAWTAPAIIDSLASPAAAASGVCPDGATPSDLTMDYTTPGVYTYTTGPGVTSLNVRAWGGGGGGGGGTPAFSGGGGGGGAYMSATVTVTECTDYTVTVGAGGANGTLLVDGSAGSDSSFGGLLLARAGQGGLTGGLAGGLGGDNSLTPPAANFQGGGRGADGTGFGGGGGGSGGDGGPGGDAVGQTAGAAGGGSPPGAAGGTGGGGIGGAGGAPSAPGGGGGGGEIDGGDLGFGGPGAAGAPGRVSIF